MFNSYIKAEGTTSDNIRMIKQISIILFFLFKIENAASSPYTIIDHSFIDTPGSINEITQSTPVKSQDGIAVCYGFSATSLLESFRCRELNLDCSDPSEFLSTFDVSSYNSGNIRTLEEIGYAKFVLENIQKSKRNIAREECAPISSLVHKKLFFNTDAKSGWDFLVNKWKEYKGLGIPPSDCVSCLVEKIKSTLGRMKTSDDQLQNAFKSSSFLDEFLYKSVMPLDCLTESKVATIPPFTVKRFPKENDISSNLALKSKIQTLLNASIPIEIGICIDENYTDGKCQSSHSIALFGIKEACHKGECRTVVKVKNSYGASWQQKMNDGWLDLEALIKSSREFSSLDNISWIEKL